MFPADVWYGWRATGVDAEALWQRPTAELVAVQREAGERGIVPARTEDELESIGAQIELLKLDHVLEAPAPGTTARLGELLATARVGLDLSQRRAIAGAVAVTAARRPA